jgi:hypothetical protein
VNEAETSSRVRGRTSVRAPRGCCHGAVAGQWRGWQSEGLLVESALEDGLDALIAALMKSNST